MATHYYLTITANQASNMSAEIFSYSEIKQVAKGCYVVRMDSGNCKNSLQVANSSQQDQCVSRTQHKRFIRYLSNVTFVVDITHSSKQP